MEQEKLNAEKQDFNKIKEDFKQKEVECKEEEDRIIKEFRHKRKEKKGLVSQIEDLNNHIYKIENRMKKCDENLVEYKHHKHFLDVLGIMSGKKKYNPLITETDIEQEHDEKPRSRATNIRKPEGTFLTNVGIEGNSPTKVFHKQVKGGWMNTAAVGLNLHDAKRLTTESELASSPVSKARVMDPSEM